MGALATDRYPRRSRYIRTANSSQAPLPEESLLDADEGRMLSYLTDPSSGLHRFGDRIQSRVQAIQSSLEFKVDSLADRVHKLDQRVVTAGRQADQALGLGASRLKEREEKEKAATGTRALPTMEVLRSLGRILPEPGGD